MDAVQNDLSDVAKLDQHFTDRRAQELALEAETQRAQHVVQMGRVRNERIRKVGLAALAAGAGVGLALFGASFLIAPNTRVVTKEVPGPERVVTVTKEVPGPERLVVKEVPGPERVVTKEVPGPERVVTKEVPGPERVVTREVPGPERLVVKEVPGPERVVVKEVPGPERVIHDAPVPPVTADSSSKNCSTMDGKTSYPCDKPSPYAPKTPDEQKFTDKPEYKDAAYRGPIIKSVDGKALSFEDGKSIWPAHWNETTSKTEVDTDRAFESDPYIGDLAMCVIDEARGELWRCTAMHDGEEVVIRHKPKGTSADAAPQPSCPPSVSKNGMPILVPRPESCAPPAKSAGGPTTADANMVNVNVDVAGYQVKAMVDTGCSFPMAIPFALATALLHGGRATFAGETKSLLADGKQVDVGVIMIKSITVDGRTLNGVEASVSPSNSAPILLGLSALNRLGPFTIDNGRIVFTGNQPA